MDVEFTRAQEGRRATQTRGPLPIHIQISELLLREISAGRLADGARLPPERDMAAQFGVAVGTLRRALLDLTERGVLDRIQGSGNYVRASATTLGVYAFFRLELIEGGGLPTAETLSSETMPKPSDLPDFGPAAHTHRIRRIRRLNGIPAALEEIWLDGSRAERVDAGEVSESLYLHYRVALGFSISRIEDRVGVAQTPDWRPPAFGLATGAAAGFVERISWDGSDQKAEFSRTWFDPAHVRYVARFR
jgi:GntR family transcriptional regulator